MRTASCKPSIVDAEGFACKRRGGYRSVIYNALWGTTLNQLPIGLHVKILNFNGRFEAYWATFGMLSWYQSIQNRWKFNICFNVWLVVGIVFAVRARKQRPPCFWPDFKPQNAIPPSSHHTGLLSSLKQYFIFFFAFLNSSVAPTFSFHI